MTSSERLRLIMHRTIGLTGYIRLTGNELLDKWAIGLWG